GLNSALADFQYNGNPGVLTLTGLTVGTVYELRLYDARFGTAFANRNITFTFNNGGNTASYAYNEDGLNNANYFGFRYVARATSVTLTAAIQVSGNTYHWYAATNEALTGATQTLTVGDSNDFTFAGSINGPGTIVKQGTGSMMLQGANVAFPGNTTVAA